MKYLALSFFFILFGSLFVHAQGCEQKLGIEVRLFDENEKRVKNASFEFLELSKDDPLVGLQFVEQVPASGALGSLYLATFCERKGVEPKYEIGTAKQYEFIVSAKGYRPAKHKISICYSREQCSVRKDSIARNEALASIVSESATLVTITGTMRIVSSSYNEKGRLVSTERPVSGVTVHFKRTAMVGFYTKSDADGKYSIEVPAGKYGVYAAVNPHCVICIEYFNNDFVVPEDKVTQLDMLLRFHGEG